MRRVIFLFLITLLSTSINAQNQAETVYSRDIRDLGIHGLTVDNHIDQVKRIFTKAEGISWQRIKVEGIPFLNEAGKPELPAKHDLILIPEGKKAKIEVLSFHADTFNQVQVYPAQPPKTDDGSPTEAFAYNTDFYKKDIWYPKNIADLKQDQKLRGIRIGTIQFTPFQYNPAKKQLIVYYNVKYRITFPGAQQFIQNKQKHSRKYLDMLPSNFLNAKSIAKEVRSFTASAKTNNHDYLIVSHSNFSMAADSLAQWKRQLGYNVRIIERNTWTAAQVKDSIHSAWQSSSVYPDYFVILGDHQFVPAELVNANHNRYSDLYYACMDSVGDYYPDMAHGRITAASQQEALMVVRKIIRYEKNPPQSAQFYNNGLNCAYFQDDDTSGYASRRFVHTSEDVKNYLESQAYSIHRVYYTEPHITPTNYNLSHYSDGQPLPSALLKSNGFQWNGNSQDVVNEINNGRFYVLHRDHGFTDGWGEPDFTSADIPFLNNQEELAVVFSINCSSGKFTSDICFAEKLMRKPNGGAVGVIAASATSYSGYNDGFSLGIFDAIWASPGLIPDFGTGGNSNPALSPHGNIREMGFVLNQALLRMVETWADSRATHELMHYHGDPAMRIWTSQPQPITATHQDSLLCNNTSLAINTVSTPNATATLVLNGEILVKQQLTSGTNVLNFPAVNNIQPYAILTISKEGFQPYEAKIPINGCTNAPIADFFVADTSLSCFNSISNIYGSSSFQPDSLQWHFSPNTVNILNGNAGSKNIRVQFTDTGYYDIRLIARNTFGSDTALSVNKVYVYPSLQSPYEQTVENFNSFGKEDSVWIRYSNSSYEWRTHQDSTPSFSTGPIVDHTLGTDQGHFFYTEASSGHLNDTAMLISPAINISNLSNPALKFWYHMYGANIKELHIDASDGNGWQNLKTIYGQQHTAYNDAWQQQFVDLLPLQGNCIKIRFTAIRGNGYKGDIAIDDIKVINFNNSPDVDMAFNNNYICCGHQVQFEDLSCCGTTARQWRFPGGNPVSSSQKSPMVTYDSAGVYSVILTVQNSNGSDSLKLYYEIEVGSNNPLPLTEDFESFSPGNPGSFYNDWFSDKTDDYEWRIESGSTPSSATGPAVDHTTGTSSGVYVYTEASYVSQGEEAYLYTPCLKIPSEAKTYLSFWTHMYGSGIDTIHIDAYDGNQWHNDIFRIGGPQQQNQTDAWEPVTADISSLAGKNARIRFRSVRSGSYFDDKAIDDVHFFSGKMDIIPDTNDFGSFYAVKGMQDTISVVNTSLDTVFTDSLTLPDHYHASSIPANILPGDTAEIIVALSPGPGTNTYDGYMQLYSNINKDSCYLKAKVYSSIESVSNRLNLKIYPNPADDFFILHASDNFPAAQYNAMIYSADGRLLNREFLFIQEGDKIKIDIRQLTAGMYYLILQSNRHTAAEKLIIK